MKKFALIILSIAASCLATSCTHHSKQQTYPQSRSEKQCITRCAERKSSCQSHCKTLREQCLNKQSENPCTDKKEAEENVAKCNLPCHCVKSLQACNTVCSGGVAS